MRTQAQIDAARINGTKSHGPKSPEGRQKSAMNALLHGLFAQTLVLSHEDREEFDRLHLSYIAKFQPADEVESGLVQEMVASKWRRKRAWALETNTLDLELIRQEEQISRQFTHIDDGMRLAAAHESLSNQSKALAQIARAEAGYSRQFDRALKNLLKLRRAGIVSVPLEEIPIEPENSAGADPGNTELQNEPDFPPGDLAAGMQNEPKRATVASRAPEFPTAEQIVAGIESLPDLFKQYPDAAIADSEEGDQ